MNSLINNSEHLLLIMYSAKSFEICMCQFKYSHGALTYSWSQCAQLADETL